MNLRGILANKKTSILKKWLDVITERSSLDISHCLKTQENNFLNLIGSTFSKGLEDLFDEIISGPRKEKTSGVLDDIVKIFAVQEYLPSRALSFFFSLKKIIREELQVEMSEQHLSDDIRSLESAVDNIALSAFDLFMKSREKMYEIKANETTRMNFRLLQWANRKQAASGHQPDPRENNFTLKLK